MQFFTSRCLDERFWDLLYFICWRAIHSIAIFFTGRKCVDLVVIFNKWREETFVVFLQNRKSCVYIKYLTLVQPQKFLYTCFYTPCKMHKTPVLLKNFAFHLFIHFFTLPLFAFFQKKTFLTSKKSLSCLYLRHGVYLNSTSNMFAYLLIIFLGRNWFGFFLNKLGYIRYTP